MVENQVMSKACEICNSEYLVDSKYCPTCGSKNEEYVPSNQINEIKEDIKNSKYYNKLSVEEISYLGENPYDNNIKEKICPNCGCRNTSDSQFCEECGTELSDSEEKIKTIVRNICPHCGAIAYDGDKFCAECGQKL